MNPAHISIFYLQNNVKPVFKLFYRYIYFIPKLSVKSFQYLSLPDTPGCEDSIPTFLFYKLSLFSPLPLTVHAEYFF